MSGVESFIPGMDGVTGVTEKYVTGVTPGEQLGVSMTSTNNTYLQPTGETCEVSFPNGPLTFLFSVLTSPAAVAAPVTRSPVIIRQVTNEKLRFDNV